MSEPSNTPGGVGNSGTPNAQMSAQPTTQPATPNAQPKPEAIQFRSSEIGIVTARKEDLFKEHKARAAEQKAKTDKLRKKLLIILAVIVGLILIAWLIWWLIGILNQPKK